MKRKKERKGEQERKKQKKKKEEKGEGEQPDNLANSIFKFFGGHKQNQSYTYINQIGWLVGWFCFMAYQPFSCDLIPN